MTDVRDQSTDYTLYLQSDGTVERVDHRPDASRCRICGIETDKLRFNEARQLICSVCAAPIVITATNFAVAMMNGQDPRRYHGVSKQVCYRGCGRPAHIDGMCEEHFKAWEPPPFRRSRS